jgi:hypothetical protein
MAFPTKHKSPSKIIFIIKKLHNNKSPGHDLVTNKIFKYLPKKAIIFLAHIFNSILSLSYIPHTLKYSIIILIQKPGKPTDSPPSYRLISLQPYFSKILEKIILKTNYPIINVNKIIPNIQFGFQNNTLYTTSNLKISRYHFIIFKN